MSDCNEITSDLKRNGTDQAGRYDLALDPGSLKLQGFGIADWMEFAYDFARHVNYFSTSDDQNPVSDWQAFFKNDTEIKKLLESYQQDNKLTPHLTLFICFLRLLELSTHRMNLLTKRHLDFYYAEVLHIEKLPATADKVHVLFELAKNIAQLKIEKGTKLDGGKDKLGKKRIYEVADELAANKAKVVQLRNVYNDPEYKNLKSPFIKAAPVANSYDGLGKKFPTDDTSWRPFGYAGAEPIELPDARLGFAVASQALSLSEGTRRVAVETIFSANFSQSFSRDDLMNNIDVYYTGEKGWAGPFTLSDDFDGDPSTPETENIGMDQRKLTLVSILDTGAEAVVNYNPEIHGEQFDTGFPIFRFIVRITSQTGYGIYKMCSGLIEMINVRVEVRDMRNLVLESDTGTLNAQKPFYPFTTNPVKGSAFSVFNEEIASKKWNSMDINIHWKSTPDNFNDYYRAYDKKFATTVSKEWTLDIQQAADFPIHIANFPLKNLGLYEKYNSIVTNDAYFRFNTALQVKDSWKIDRLNNVLFQRGEPTVPGEVVFETQFSVDGGYAPNESGPVKMILQQSFLHELYPRIYALALTSETPGVLIPNQPYTPFADDITVSYTASDSLIFVNNATSKPVINSEATFENRSLQLFHIQPFGQAESHPYLDIKTGIADDLTLTPVYCKGGELYIGLENAVQLQQVSLLVQVLEGTENPQADSFSGDQKVMWDVMCNNRWKSLNSTYMQVNQIDNFLKSGLVKFPIPVEATTNNTSLPAGLIWIRAKMFKRYDAVCKILSINAQAVLAVFDNKGNELSHLEKGIEADTITKLTDRIAQVKSVTQPYNSFGGKPEETDLQYYRRVSERLRHKNRAITLFDYEHLVLQQFPQIYKAKCLNHTCDCSFLSGGNVTIVVIPDTIRKNVFDLYQPRVSKALLNEITEYLSELNSLHVKTEVINPEYEEVTVSLKVKFREGLDIDLYKQQLNKDITMFLSPWAFEQTESITFGVELHNSVLIDYIEKLNYVDYLADVTMQQGDSQSKKICTPSTPKSILVSARNHVISTNIETCSTNSKPAQEICQL